MSPIRLRASSLVPAAIKHGWRWIVGGAVSLMLAATTPSTLSAHGEAADEPFLKVLTTAFHDVSVTPTDIKVGEPVTITGTIRVLDTWPYTLKAPEMAYLTAVVPGPVFVMKERVINGAAAPHSIFIQRGGVYQFRMVVLGRQPGRWHV